LNFKSARELPIMPVDLPQIETIPSELVSYRQKIDSWLGVAIEVIVLALVILSPWAFAAVEPLFEFWLYAGISLLLLMWAARMLMQGQFVWKKCPVILCVAALFLLAIWQLQPLPPALLRLLSPSTASLFAELLPADPEVLPFGETRPTVPLVAGSALSLYPAATLQALIRLLAVFVLLAVVRNNITSTGALRRLSIALVINGTCLAFFALIQFFTCPRDTVYWSYKTQGSVFGPFVCRTHYAFYVNACIGAAIGLLLSLEPMVSSVGHGGRRHPRDPGAALLGALRALLADPVRPWLIGALALMVGSVYLSLSRGAVLALSASFCLLFLVPDVRLRRYAWRGAAIVIGLSAVFLVTWLGGKTVQTRIATLWTGEALTSRVPLWTDSWPLFLEFPLLGTGFGTFAYVEPLHRAHTESIFIHEHAHNEFLEALIEGGIVRLLISIVAIGLVFRFGWRAIRRNAGEPASALALGALFGFTSIVLQSIGDFGIHLPAIAFLTTVLVGQLVAAGQETGVGYQEADVKSQEAEVRSKKSEVRNQDAGSSAQITAEPEALASKGEPEALVPGEAALGAGLSTPPTNAYVLHGWGLAPVAGALTAIALAAVLWTEGRRLELVQRLVLTAVNLQGKNEPAERERQIALLEAAGRLAPAWTRVQTRIAREHLTRFETYQSRLARGRQALEATQLILNAGPALPVVPLATAGWDSAVLDERQQSARQHLLPALRAYLQARDVCPLMAEPQMRLAANVSYLQKADPRAAYLARAKRIVTNDAELYFLFGLQELLDGQKEASARSWARSLEISDQYLITILDLSKNMLPPEVLLSDVLPSRPQSLVAAAAHLFPKPESTEQRRPFFEKALALLQEQTKSTAKEFLLQARVQAGLGQPEEAIASYRLALAREPNDIGSCLEMAQLQIAAGKYDDARQELMTILRQHRDHPEAKRLLLLARDQQRNR
jgi:O-antigen ligase/tetratricopeptide (TPR) repeat protein